jgi:hypothetical protein
MFLNLSTLFYNFLVISGLTFFVMHLDKISWVAYIIFSVIVTFDCSARGINGSHFKNAGQDALLLRSDLW